MRSLKVERNYLMPIELRLQGTHITFEQSDVMMGDSRLALLADVDKVVTIEPRSHARIPTPIAFTGDGKTIALIEMHAGRLSHALGQEDEALSVQGEYFLPGQGGEAIVHVDVINETGATLLIRPNTRLGILTFINLGSENEDVAPVADTAGVPLKATFEPLFISARDRPAYASDGSSIEIRADLAMEATVEAGATMVFTTGLSIDVPAGYEAQLRPNALLPMTVSVENRPISSVAEHLVTIALKNSGDEPIAVKPGQAIAQLVVTPVTRPTLIFTAAERQGENRLGTGR
jgi:dUTP pyrophosphatase